MKKALFVFAFMLLLNGCGDQRTLKLNREHVTDTTWAIEPKYDNAYDFSSGLALVSTGNIDMFIDKSGNNNFNIILSKINGEYTKNFTRWLPIVTEVGQIDAYRLNIYGKELKKQSHNVAAVYKKLLNETNIAEADNGRFGVINSIGQWIIEPTYSGLDTLRGDFPKNSKGFFNQDLTFVEIPQGYKWAVGACFIDGYAKVLRIHKNSEVWGMEYYNFIDINGNLLLKEDIVHEGYGPSLYDGMILYSENNRYGYMDIMGNVKVEPQFLYAEPFHNGFALVETVNGAKNFIDKQADVVLSLRNTYDGGLFENNMVEIIVKEDKSGIMNKSGKWLVKPRYDDCYYIEEHNVWELNYTRNDETITDLYFVEMDMLIKNYQLVNMISDTAFTGLRGEKEYFVDVRNHQILTYEFESIGKLSEGLMSVICGGKFGYIDTTGNLIIDFQFDLAEPFSEGLAAVCVDGKWGYIANPLIYPHWEPEELQRARLLGLTPEDESDGIISGDDFAGLLAKAFEIELLISGSNNTLTRKTAAELIALVAEQKGKYYRYFLPDCDDWHNVSDESKYQTGFAIQTGVIKLQDSLFNESAEVSCNEAYVIALRLYEYLR